MTADRTTPRHPAPEAGTDTTHGGRDEATETEERTAAREAEAERAADTAAIRQVIADASAHQSDPGRFLPLHTPDASVVNFGGRRVLGRDALEEAMGAALASPLAKVLTTVEVLDIRFVRPDVAIAVSVKHVSDERDEDEGGPLPGTSGSLTYVMEKSDKPGIGWRISHAQTTPILG
ncbi:SgcJ/EcaC family oxidoreductase [Streptomyces sp. JNUCC 64]